MLLQPACKIISILCTRLMNTRALLLPVDLCRLTVICLAIPGRTNSHTCPAAWCSRSYDSLFLLALCGLLPGARIRVGGPLSLIRRWTSPHRVWLVVVYRLRYGRQRWLPALSCVQAMARLI